MKLAIALILIAVLFIGFLMAAMAIRSALRPPDKPVVKLLKQHAYYTAKAAQASRKGQEGVCNVYTEAANDLWKQLETAPWNGETIGRPPVVARPPVSRVTYGDARDRIPEHLLKRAEVARRKNS